MNISYWMKRPLHRVAKKRFLPSKLYCERCKHHVQSNHFEKQPSHRVRSYGAKLTKPKLEQFKRRMRPFLVVLPSKVDYRPILEAGDFEVFDQGSQGSCTANAGCADKAFQEILSDTYPGPFSRAFLYYESRKLHGWENEDSGAYMEDIGIVLGSEGVCLDTTMPYSQYDYATPPDQDAIGEATAWATNRDQTRLSWGNELKAALVDGPVLIGGVPVGLPRIGVPIYSSFTASEYNGGWVPVPKANEELLGGHALLVVGYDDEMSWGSTKGYFIVLNSWGTIQGAKGYQFFPYDYETLTGPQSDNWQQFDETPGPGPGPGPGPTTCEEDFNKEYPKCLTLSEVWDMIFCLVDKTITYWICALGELAFQKAIRKKKTMQRTLRAKSGSKYRVTLTITEPKK